MEYLKNKGVDNMAAVTYEDMISLIPNATMQKVYVYDNHTQYKIEAVDGYVLHDSRIDEEEFDHETMQPTGNIIPRFKLGSTTVPASYDFTATTNGTYTYTDENNMEVTIPVVKIGMYEFYTLPENIVPTNQTCGGGDNNHEVM
jgi:hypothetical protein